MILRSGLLVVVLLGWSAAAAWAHPGHQPPSGNRLLDGLIHPWTGIDHLLTLLAVGLLAQGIQGQGVRRRMSWLLPLAFLSSMLAGAVLGNVGWGPPGAEAALPLSLVVMGAALAVGRTYPNVAVAVVVVLCGIIHGHAHGTDMSASGTSGSLAALQYLGGLLTGSALLLASGAGLGFAAGGWPQVARLCGGAVFVAGLGLLLALD